jgi:hypothetical protein
MNNSVSRTEATKRTLALGSYLTTNWSTLRDLSQKQIAERARVQLNNPTITFHHISLLIDTLNLRPPAATPKSGITPGDNPRNNWLRAQRQEILNLTNKIEDLTKRITALEDAFK